MRLVVGLCGLVLVLALVGGLLRTQLKALRPAPPSVSASAPASAPAAETPAAAARRIDKQLGDDAARTLEQGARRNDEGEAGR